MSDREYAKKFFSRYANEWLKSAYGPDGISPKYPIGANRVRITLECLHKHLKPFSGQILDLGCGGGDLCFLAAEEGLQAVGVDIADGMINQANARLNKLTSEKPKRVSFHLGDFRDAFLPANSFKAVVALGVIEYLDSDEPLFTEAYRVLEPGGLFILSCRNRLFNMASLNQFTKNEIASGDTESIIDEIIQLGRLVKLDDIEALLNGIKTFLPELEAALSMDKASENATEKNDKDRFYHSKRYTNERRFHSPLSLQKTMEKYNFIHLESLGAHPHPLPPSAEASAPHFFNTFSKVFNSIENTGLGLLWSSAFITVFRKREGQAK